DRHLDVLAAEPEGRTAAVHGRVAAANDHDPPADAVDVLEGDRGQEVDANMNIGGAFLTARDVEVLPLGGSGADEYGVEPLVENGLEARHLVTEARLDPEVENAVHFLVENIRRQAEGWDVRPHQAAAVQVLLE